MKTPGHKRLPGGVVGGGWMDVMRTTSWVNTASAQHQHKVQHCAMPTIVVKFCVPQGSLLLSSSSQIPRTSTCCGGSKSQPHPKPFPSHTEHTQCVVVVWTRLTAPDWLVRSVLAAARLYKLSRNKGMVDRCFNTCLSWSCSFRLLFVGSRFVSLIRCFEMKQSVSV